MHKPSILSSAVGILVIASSAISFADNLTPQKDTKREKWGFVDASGKWVVKPKYDNAEKFITLPSGIKAARVSAKSLCGYVDDKGKPLGVGIEFESIDSISPKSAIVKVKDKYGIADWGFNYLLKPEFASIEKYDDNHFLASKGDKIGIVSSDGTILLPIEYTSAEPINADYYKILKGDKYGIFSAITNCVAVSPKYAEVKAPTIVNGTTLFSVFAKNGKTGVVSDQDKEIIPAKYDDVVIYPGLDYILLVDKKGHNAFFPKENVSFTVDGVSTQNRNSFLHLHGIVKSPGTANMTTTGLFNTYFPYGELNALISPDWKLITTSPVDAVEKVGNCIEITSKNVKNIYSPKGDLVAKDVKGNGKIDSGWVLYSNRLISPELVEYSIGNAPDGIVAVLEPKASGDDQWRLFHKGKLSKECYQSFQKGFYDNLIFAVRTGKFGVLKDGEEILPCEFDNSFTKQDTRYGDRYIFSKNGKMGLLDGDFKNLVPFEYDKIELWGDVFLTTVNGKEGVIQHSGKVIIPSEYEYISWAKGSFLIKKDGKYGLLNNDGNQILPVQYENLNTIYDDDNDNNLLWAQLNGKYGVVTSQGEQIVPHLFADGALTSYKSGYFIGKIGNTRKCYNWSGAEIPVKREVVVTKQSLEFNEIGYKNKSMKVKFACTSRFIDNDNEEIYVTAKAYKENGQPAYGRSGRPIEKSMWIKPNGYTFSTFSDLWINLTTGTELPYSNKKQNYYVRITFQDESGRAIPTSGNSKLTFWTNP